MSDEDRSPLTDDEQQEVDRHMERAPSADRAQIEDAMRRRRQHAEWKTKSERDAAELPEKNAATLARSDLTPDERREAEIAAAAGQSAESAVNMARQIAHMTNGTAADDAGDSQVGDRQRERLRAEAEAPKVLTGKPKRTRKPKPAPEAPKVDEAAQRALMAKLGAALPWGDEAAALLTRIVYAEHHDGADCPRNRRPSAAELDELDEWVGAETQSAIATEVAAILRDVARALGDSGEPFGPSVHLVMGDDGLLRVGSMVLRDDGQQDPAPALAALNRIATPGGRAAVLAALGEDGDDVDDAELHDLWCQCPPHLRPRHPLGPVVAAWQRFAPFDWDDRRHAVLPAPLVSREGGTGVEIVCGDMRQLALGMIGADRFQTEPLPSTLPGIEPLQPGPVPVLPFVGMFDRAGGASIATGGGASHALRLFVECVMAVPAAARRSKGPPAVLTCTLRQLVEGLWPRGWQRGRDWLRLLAGLEDLARLGVEWEHGGTGGVWATVTVRNLPRDGAALDDVCRFEVLLPPGSGSGPMVDRTPLRLLGLDSAPAFRLYLALCWLWDRHGTFRGHLIGPTHREVRRDDAGYVVGARGDVLTDRGGRPSRRAAHREAVATGRRIVNPAALERYPALSPDDLAVMAYAPADLAAPRTAHRRVQRQRARSALELVAKVSGAAVLPTQRADQVVGCVRVMPPESHKAAHDAAAELRREARGKDTRRPNRGVTPT